MVKRVAILILVSDVVKPILSIQVAVQMFSFYYFCKPSAAIKKGTASMQSDKTFLHGTHSPVLQLVNIRKSDLLLFSS